MPAKGKQFKRVTLPMQSPEEVRAVVAKGNAVAREREAATESTYETDLKRIGREEKAHGRAVQQSLSGKGAQAKDFEYMPTLSDREHGALQLAQNRFERTPAGPAREEHRRTIGRAIQKGVVDSTKITRLACQTPNCGSSVSMEASGGDVVCAGCKSSGDKAGATYRDRPATAVSGDRSDVGRKRKAG